MAKRVRIATQSHKGWTRIAAEWNPGLIISIKLKGELEDQPKDGKTTSNLITTPTATPR